MALAMAQHTGDKGWRDMVPEAVTRYEAKHGVKVDPAEVLVLKGWLGGSRLGLFC